MKRTGTRWNRWKILGVALCLYAAGAGIILAGVIWWISSTRGKEHRQRETALWTETRRVRPPEPPVQEPTRLENTPAEEKPKPGPATAERPATNQPPSTAAPSPPPETGAKASGNAILRPLIREDRSRPGDDLFKDAFIPRLEIEILPAEMSRLRNHARTYVRASIREGAIVHTNVAIHLKGGPGTYRELNDRPSFTVNFDKFTEGQTFHGLKKIHLNNARQDQSFLSEKICRELFEASGVPAPRAGNAAVIFNGRKMGMYVLVEGINKQFLKRYFKDVTGNVYDGHSGTDVSNRLPTNFGENPQDDSRLKALARAVRLPVGDRLPALERTLDLDRFLSFMAMESMLWHWDGYTMNRNNFRIYHDRDTDRMVFLPQGLDQVLTDVNGAIVPQRVNGMVAKAILEIPEVHRRYEERVAQLAANVFRNESIKSRIDEVAKKINSTFMEIDPDAAASHRPQVATLTRRFRQRTASLQRQLSPASAPRLERFETLSLTEWEPQTDQGDAQLSREKDNDGNVLLRISSAARCTASWRHHVVLEKGSYRFEARLKTRGVELNPGDPRDGAGLRVSRHRVGQKNSGDRDWIPATFDIEVKENQSDVELVCELRANEGEVWFDQRSLRISQRN